MSTNGNQILIQFIKDTKEGISNFDNFTILEELSQNKITKKAIIAVFEERNERIKKEVKDVKNL